MITGDVAVHYRSALFFVRFRYQLRNINRLPNWSTAEGINCFLHFFFSPFVLFFNPYINKHFHGWSKKHVILLLQVLRFLLIGIGWLKPIHCYWCCYHYNSATMPVCNSSSNVHPMQQTTSIRFPRVFVSFGRTNSVSIEYDSRGVLF